MKIKVLLILCVIGLIFPEQQFKAVDTQTQEPLEIYCEYKEPMYVEKQYNITFIILNTRYGEMNASNFWFKAKCDEKMIFSTMAGLTDKFEFSWPLITSGCNITVVVIPQHTGISTISVFCGSDNIKTIYGDFEFILKEMPTKKITITKVPEFPLIPSFTAIFGLLGLVAWVLWRRR